MWLPNLIKNVEVLVLKQSVTKNPQDGKKKKGFHNDIPLLLVSEGTTDLLVAMGETRPGPVPQAPQFNPSSALVCWEPLGN